MIFVFLRLISPSMMITRSIHIATGGIISLKKVFLRFSGKTEISFSIWINVCVCKCLCLQMALPRWVHG